MSDIKFLNINTVEHWDKPTYNDIEFLENNDIKQVYNSDYVAQATAKVLKTDKNSSVPYPNYGTNLSQIRKSVAGNSLLESQVADDIVEAMSYIKTLEESPSEKEQIAGIDNMITKTLNLDKFNKAVSVTMSVVAKSGDIIKVTV